MEKNNGWLKTDFELENLNINIKTDNQKQKEKAEELTAALSSL